MGYESLLVVAENLNLTVYETRFKSNAKALLKGNLIGINKELTEVEKVCALAEEIAHHLIGSGDILDQRDIRNRKQELRARQMSYFDLVPLSSIVNAYKARISGRHEIAEFLGVTEDFLQHSINRYTEKFGLAVVYEEKYIIRFDPLGVAEIF